MIRPALALACALAALLTSTACPDPEEVGHAPKKQIDMAQQRLDAASAKAMKQADEAAKLVDETK